MKKIYAMAALCAALAAPAANAAVSYTANPAPGHVDLLDVITVTFDGTVELAEESCLVDWDNGKFGNSSLNPRYESEYTVDYGPQIYCLDQFKVVDGNTLYLSRGVELDPDFYIVAGDWFEIWIKGASYTVNGQPGEDIRLHYSFTFVDGEMVVEPLLDAKVAGLNKVEISFYNSAVDMAEGAETDFMAGVTGATELQPTYFTEKDPNPQLFTNYLFKVENDVLTLERYAELNYENTNSSDFVTITVPAGSYLVEGEEGEEIVLTYFFDPYTGVKSFFGEETRLEIYDLQGRQIVKNGDANAVKGLKGLYIVNGKKVLF
ncbi:MAG: hypothetical protein HDS26_00685 [Bacteroides sp.]|nr:hypothetical protein [Bacteroides sp.]